MQFGQYVQQQLQSQGMPMQGFNPGAGNQQMYQDPNHLAQRAAQLHQQQPGLLANPAAKAALAGIAAVAISNAMGGRAGSPLGSIL